jgi:hypothetical protein
MSSIIASKKRDTTVERNFNAVASMCRLWLRWPAPTWSIR